MKSLSSFFDLTSADFGAKHNATDYGKMTTVLFVSEKGEPLQKSYTHLKDVTLFEYGNNKKYQVKDGIVSRVVEHEKK